ncbi:LppX_LprAFG lipoprotein [Solicola sp. PLA-1-18]|uniref:LppX_LprAFG lipoprotein n=1 Tax=Solicola sp. PLA-1-18 TaxID=3380532 RepID=UPI003B80EE5A
MKLRPTLVAGIAAAALTLTACGGGAEQAASDEASNVSSGTTATLTQANFVDQVGQAQREARTTHLTLKADAGSQQVEAEGDVEVGESGADSSMAMKLTVPGMGQVEVRLVDGTLYTNLGPLSENKFATIDLDDPSNPLAKSFGGVVDQMDPAASLKALEGSITSFEKKGSPKEIDGVQAQPYEVVVDTAKAQAAAGAGAEASGSTAGVPSEVTATFWVGEDNLPRRVTTQVSGADVRLDFSKWGEDVDVQAPPADQITKNDPFKGALPTPTS